MVALVQDETKHHFIVTCEMLILASLSYIFISATEGPLVSLKSFSFYLFIQVLFSCANIGIKRAHEREEAQGIFLKSVPHK